MRMIHFQKGQILSLIILMVIFFLLPVKGFTNDLPEETTESIEAEIYSAFLSLNGAVEWINHSDSITGEQLTEEFPGVKIDTKKEPLIWVQLNSGHKVWILPSFYWGCFFGPIGVIVTGIVSKWQKKYLTDSLAGMIVNLYVVADVALYFFWMYIIMKMLSH
jgi:hypothetical protein